jgi:hypothetical protein
MIIVTITYFKTKQLIPLTLNEINTADPEIIDTY